VGWDASLDDPEFGEAPLPNAISPRVRALDQRASSVAYWLP
jgi:hypothetical protein